VQTTVDEKRRQQRQQKEDLEQSETHRRQLSRTLELLQGGVQEILEKSANDSTRTEEAKQLAMQQRQEALKTLVASGSFRIFHFNVQQASSSSTREQEDEDDKINDDHHNDIRLYASKKRNARLDSIESMISTISDSKSIHTHYSPPSRRQHHRATWNTTTATTRSSRSCCSRRSNRSRSNKSRSRSSRSLSRGRRKHKRGTHSKTASGEEPKKTSLMNMLEIENEYGTAAVTRHHWFFCLRILEAISHLFLHSGWTGAATRLITA
jgi:hypothetical protein